MFEWYHYEELKPDAKEVSISLINNEYSLDRDLVSTIRVIIETYIHDYLPRENTVVQIQSNHIP